jgi:hypothetical protein
VKKPLILFFLLAFAAQALIAGGMLLVGGSMGYASQNTAAGHPWNATSFGLLAQTYVDISETLGLYTAASLGLVTRAQDNGISLDTGQYQTLSLNALFGPGYKLFLTPSLIGIAGAGIYIGSNMLSGGSQSLSSYYAGGFGVGAGISLLYRLSFNFGFGANVNAAYSFANPGDVTSTMSPNGLSVFGGIGVCFFFYPEANYQRFSRY